MHIIHNTVCVSLKSIEKNLHFTITPNFFVSVNPYKIILFIHDHTYLRLKFLEHPARRNTVLPMASLSLQSKVPTNERIHLSLTLTTEYYPTKLITQQGTTSK